MYDLIVVGAGASGLIASVVASRNNKKVLLLEKLPQIGTKLKASGGGKCNLTNTLSPIDFMAGFGKNGRFMQDTLKSFSSDDLIKFLDDIGVQTSCLDGFRVFPSSKNSATIIKAFEQKLQELKIEVLCSTKVEEIIIKDDKIIGIKTTNDTFKAQNIIISTGGLGYPNLGTTGDGFKWAEKFGHTIDSLVPAMMPLNLKETWISNCTADTISKVTIKIDLPKAKKLKATGDLIFTKQGIRGPVVLDFTREITPFLKDNDEVPIVLNLTHGKNEEEIREHLKSKDINTLVPSSVASELITLSNNNKDKLIKLLAWTPLTVTSNNTFDNAMVTRGGVSLKEINPKTMESKIIKGLYFCGEVVNLDGICGGYNLQWAFSSGYVAGNNI